MLFKKLERLEELNAAEITFQNGDSFFADEHKEYEGIVSEIKKDGYSVDKVMEIREAYKQKTVAFREEAKEISREIRIAKSLVQEEEQNRSSNKGRDSVDRQPHR